MPTSRRRSGSSGFSSEKISENFSADETTDVKTEEVVTEKVAPVEETPEKEAKVVEETPKVEVKVAPPITPSPPRKPPEEEEVKAKEPEVKPQPKPLMPPKKQHPRNVPKFSKVTKK